MCPVINSLSPYLLSPLNFSLSPTSYHHASLQHVRVCRVHQERSCSLLNICDIGTDSLRKYETLAVLRDVPQLTCVRTVLLFVGAGTVFRLAYHRWAVATFPIDDDDRALLSRPLVRPVSRIAFPVAGVNNGRVYACSAAARPKAPALSPSALVRNEDSH